LLPDALEHGDARDDLMIILTINLDNGYWLGGGGFIKIMGEWQSILANPPLQVLSNI